MEGNTSAGNETLALVGPGRAGTTITLALLELGWRVGRGRRPRARRAFDRRGRRVPGRRRIARLRLRAAAQRS